jgi:hypothetical protein
MQLEIKYTLVEERRQIVLVESNIHISTPESKITSTSQMTLNQNLTIVIASKKSKKTTMGLNHIPFYVLMIAAI